MAIRPHKINILFLILLASDFQCGGQLLDFAYFLWISLNMPIIAKVGPVEHVKLTTLTNKM